MFHSPIHVFIIECSSRQKEAEGFVKQLQEEKSFKMKGGSGNDLMDPVALYTSEVPVEFVSVRMK